MLISLAQTGCHEDPFLISTKPSNAPFPPRRRTWLSWPTNNKSGLLYVAARIQCKSLFWSTWVHQCFSVVLVDRSLDLCVVLTRRVTLVEQELLTLPEPLSSPMSCWSIFSLSFCPVHFGHCVVCASSIYEFWLIPLSHFQALLI